MLYNFLISDINVHLFRSTHVIKILKLILKTIKMQTVIFQFIFDHHSYCICQWQRAVYACCSLVCSLYGTMAIAVGITATHRDYYRTKTTEISYISFYLALRHQNVYYKRVNVRTTYPHTLCNMCIHFSTIYALLCSGKIHYAVRV